MNSIDKQIKSLSSQAQAVALLRLVAESPTVAMRWPTGEKVVINSDLWEAVQTWASQNP